MNKRKRVSPVKNATSRPDPRLLTHAVHVLVGIAFVLLVASTILSSVENPPITLEPDTRPFVYDLSLAILGAWIFQLLLISLPTRHKLKRYFKVFRPQLFTIAESGRQLFRDFEFISRCPQQSPPTPEHIKAVLMATNLNPATKKLMDSKMAATWTALEDLTPVAQYLSEDIQHEIQALRQNPLVRSARDVQGWQITLDEARAEVTQRWDPHMNHQDNYVRETWDSFASDFIEYYEATQIIANEIRKSRTPLKNTDRIWSNEQELTYPLWEWDAKAKGNDPEGERYPYTDYPPTANNFAPLDILKAKRNAGPAPLPPADERTAKNEEDAAEAKAVEEHFADSRRRRESQEPNSQ